MIARAKLRRIGKVAAMIVGALTLVLGPLVVRVAVDGRAELARADAALEAGDPDAEIRHLGRAARLRLPIAGHDALALARLAERAERAEQADHLALALGTWRELRRALIGARVIDVSDPALLARANAAIVELMVREAQANERPSDPTRWAAELEQDLDPRGRSLFAALCFVAWLGACVGFFSKGIDAKGRLDPRPALRWGGSVLLLLIAWILLM